MINPAIRHQTFVQRYAGGVTKEILALLRKLDRQVQNSVQGIESRTASATIAQIAGIYAEAGDELKASLSTALVEFAQYEGEFQSRLLAAVTVASTVNTPTAAVLAALVDRSALEMVQGGTLVRKTAEQLINEFMVGSRRSVETVIRTAVIEGLTTQQATKEIARIAKNRTRNQAEALTRTLVNHIGSVARAEVYRDNADIIVGERYMATLDARTTLTCSGFDGKRFDIGEGPHPPMHFNCRSVRVPVIAEEFRIPGQADRASVNGPVDGRTTYGGWLKGQPKEFQNEVLGPERAALFRSGKVSISKFTDSRGAVYSLAELKQREGITI